MSKRKQTKQWVSQTVGASSKQQWKDRTKRLDGYHTPKIATTELIRLEKLSKNIWEPANGFSRISKVFRKKGFNVYTSDIHRWHSGTEKQRSFMNFSKLPFKKGCDIITNPPFVRAQDFVETAMKLLKTGGKLALLLRVQFLEGKKRKEMFTKYPPKRVWVFSYRLPRMHQFGYKGAKGGTVLAFAWFVWEKGYKGDTVVKWI